MTRHTLHPAGPSLADLRILEDASVEIALSDDAEWSLARSAEALGRIMASGRLVYGVNTGFGPLSGTRIEAANGGELQRRPVLSNAGGVGAPLAERVVRRAIILKLATLARGLSGVRPALAHALLALLNARITPLVPAKGSCGASGDLAPLAHIGAALMGIGEVVHRGAVKPAAEALAAEGLAPFILGPKEGLAIVNGTQVSTALAIDGLFRAEELFAGALLAGAMSVEAGAGNASAFDPRIQEARGQKGQIAVAAALSALLEGGPAARGGTRLQDPYCLRCQPQVMGAALDLIVSAADTLSREARGVSDNPLVDPDSDDILYGGNFHAQPVGLAADSLALAMAEIGSLSERRSAFLVDAHMSGLPAFLVAEGGLDSGFMVAQVTAASLASENKAIAHPGSIDSLPTAANQEDYVSMATYAARRLADMADNLRHILAVEMLCAAQGLDLRGRQAGMAPAPALARLHARLRARVAYWAEDRFLAPDIAAAAALLSAGHLPAEPDPTFLPSLA